MGKICKNCGKELTDNMMFCAECGTKVVEDVKPAPQPTPQVAPQPKPQPQTASQPKPAPQPTVGAEKTNKVVGLGAYFGLIVLYAIPVIGFIACIIMAFVPKNKNIKNFARAMLIWLAIGLVVGIISISIVSKVVTSITNAFSRYEEMIEQYNEINDMLEQFGNMSETLEQFSEGGTIEGFGDLEDILGQFENGELGDIIGQLENGELEDIIGQLENGELEDIIGQLENGELEDVLDQFENGELENIFGQLENGDLEDILNQFQNSDFAVE